MRKLLDYLKRYRFTSLKDFGLFFIAEAVPVIVLPLGIIAFMMWLWPAPKPDMVVSEPAPGSTTVQVRAPELTPAVIERIVQVEDKARVNALLAENAKLKAQVTSLTQTVATLRSTGEGTITQVPTETVPEELRPADPIQSPNVFAFKDWRLEFVHDGKIAKYLLTQKFRIYTTIGRNKDGVPIARSTLDEITPTGTIPAMVENTLLVQVDQTIPHWLVSPAIQAGFGVAVTTSPTTIDDGLSLADRSKGAVVSLQWLKYGRTKAAEDSTVALLSPGIFLTADAHEFALLPISMNLGQLPGNPLNDVWVSPFVTGTVSKPLSRVGIVFGSTF